MLELYFRPLACSLASRIALLDAGLAARYHQIDPATKRLVDDGGDFLAVSAKGQVPVLRLDDGTLLTENVAVLQRIADLAPAAGLAPPDGDPRRYHLQEWLSFVATEVHRSYLYLTFMPDVPDAVRAHARTRIDRPLAVLEAHLAGRPHLLGARFSVADAYLVWALLLIRYTGVDLAPTPAVAEYLHRVGRRPSVVEALAIERPLFAGAAPAKMKDEGSKMKDGH